MEPRGRFLAAFVVTTAAFAYPAAMGFWLDATWDPFSDEPTPTCGTCAIAALVSLVSATWAIVLAWRGPTRRVLKISFTLFGMISWLGYGPGGLLLAVEGPGIALLSLGMTSMTFGPAFVFFGGLLHRRWPAAVRADAPRTFTRIDPPR